MQGRFGDLRRFAEGLGYRTDREGYVSACHLCGHIRTWLYHHLSVEDRPVELAPGFFYEEMGRLFDLPRAGSDAGSLNPNPADA